MRFCGTHGTPDPRFQAKCVVSESSRKAHTGLEQPCKSAPPARACLTGVSPLERERTDSAGSGVLRNVSGRHVAAAALWLLAPPEPEVDGVCTDVQRRRTASRAQERRRLASPRANLLHSRNAATSTAMPNCCVAPPCTRLVPCDFPVGCAARALPPISRSASRSRARARRSGVGVGVRGHGEVALPDEVADPRPRHAA